MDAHHRLYHLPSGALGPVRFALDGASIHLGPTGIQAPLGPGRIALDDGAEAHAADGAPDITAGGGRRNYRRRGANG